MSENKGAEIVSFTVKAVQTYKSRKKGELSFKKNQLILITNTNEAEFLYYGQYHGKQGVQSGWFPYFYVKSTALTPVKSTNDSSQPKSKLSNSNDEGELIAAVNAISFANQTTPTFDRKKGDKEKHSSMARRSRNKILFQSSDVNTDEKIKKLDEQNYVLKSGILSKRSQTTISLWKPLWIVLRPSYITYFKSAVDKKALGKLNIETIKSVSIENGLGDSTQSYCFAINTFSKKHALILSASTLNECEEWMTMIEFAMKGGKPVTAAEQLLKKEHEKTTTTMTSSSSSSSSSSNELTPAEIQKLVSSRPKEIILRPDLSHPEYLTRILPSDQLNNNNDNNNNNHFNINNNNNYNNEGENDEEYDEEYDENDQEIETKENNNQLNQSNHLNKKKDRSGSLLGRNTNPRSRLINSKITKTNLNNHQQIDKNILKKITVIGKVRTKKEYIGKSFAEFSFRKNEEIFLIDKKEEIIGENKNIGGNRGWWFGYFNDKFGFFPANFVIIIQNLSVDLLSLIESFSPENNNNNNINNSGNINNINNNINNNNNNEEKEKEKEGSSDQSPNIERKRPEKHTTLIHNYQVGELLGVGGFGSVYRGIDVETGVMVAIKQVDLDRVNKNELKTIMGELNLLKVLDHINIVQYKGFIKTSDHLNIILDFVEGGSLFSLLNKFGPMHGDLVIRYIKQILEGLDYLHSQGVVHNDIKCGNILITKSGVVKLADFGIASLGENSDQNIVSGSPYWMGPEVIQLRGCSPASDIWSLGCTIVELLKGKPPFFEMNKMQALFAIVENDIPLPPHLSPKMEDFLKKCFKKEPELRPTAKQLLTHPLLYGNASDAHCDDDDGSEDDEDDEDPSNHLPSSDSPIKTTSSSFDSSDDEDEENSSYDEEEDEEEEEEESEEEIQFRREEKDTKELIGWFIAALDKGNTSHINRIRKAVRQKILHLRPLKTSSDPRYRGLYYLVRKEMLRCHSQFAEQIPVDPAEADEYLNDSGDDNTY